jgi:peptidoglycan/LPS O-acetylase OafA/YrhL
MRASRIIPAAAAAVALAMIAGCAALPPDQADAKQEKVYRTGSNLPQRDRNTGEVVVLDPKAMHDSISRSAGTMRAPGN